MKTTKIEDFHKITGKIKGVEKTVESHSQTASNRLKTEPKWKRNRRPPRYNPGWKFDMVYQSKTEVSGWVYNYSQWQLTWLLENGHLVTNKKGGVGWAAPHPHIKPVFDEEAERFVDDMSKLDVKIEIK